MSTVPIDSKHLAALREAVAKVYPDPVAKAYGVVIRAADKRREENNHEAS